MILGQDFEKIRHCTHSRLVYFFDEILGHHMLFGGLGAMFLLIVYYDSKNTTQGMYHTLTKC